MPVYHCCAPGCTSSSRKTSNPNKYPHLQNVKFYSLPNDKREKSKKREWIRMIRREASWRPNKYTRICSLHFDGNNTTPTLFSYNAFKENPRRRKTKNSMVGMEVDDNNDAETEETSLPEVESTQAYPYVCGETEFTCSKGYYNTGKLDTFSICTLPSTDHTYCTAGTDITQNRQDASTQTDLSSNDVTLLLQENQDLKSKLTDKRTLLRTNFVENITKSDKNVKMYTGVPTVHLLLGIFNILMSSQPQLKYWSGSQSGNGNTGKGSTRNKPGPSRKLSPFDEFVITLLRLRLGLLECVIADIFNVSNSRISQIFITWISFMSKVFNNLLKWPTKPQVIKYMPLSFRRRYPHTRAIIDCTEFYFQRPRCPTAQAATYSSYKSKNTAKCLLAISPSGTFTFVSDVYGGNVSDRYITEHSGFLDLIEEGDDIMADRGFTIRDLLTDKKATLNMPPFTRKCTWGKQKRLNADEIRKTRSIAKLRIHVERAIQRLKLFRLLSNVLPWSLKPVLNQVVKVSAFLCNLLPKLVRK